MEKVLKPERLDIDPGSLTATDEFNHWLVSFGYYLAALNVSELQFDRLQVLTNLVSPKVYKHFSNVETYKQALTLLNIVCIKPHNIIAARHEQTKAWRVGGSICYTPVTIKQAMRFSKCKCRKLQA